MLVEWLPTAESNLADIVDYIRQDNPSAARDMAETILARVAQLGDHPNLGRPGRVSRTRELVISGTPYLVPYAVQTDRVIILRVLHGRQQWPTII